MTNDLVLFEDVLPKIQAITEHPDFAGKLGTKIYLIRDIHGRIRPMLQGNRDNYEQKTRKDYERELAENLGKYAFAAKSSILFRDELELPDDLVNSGRFLGKNDNNVEIFLLDRQIIGQDWLLPRLEHDTNAKRVAFFSFKGGVGRTTAIYHWAWHLAANGRNVVVFDLDLESPGISNTLLDEEDELPDYGVVDWLVEEAVGQQSQIENDITGNSRKLATGLGGSIKVIPAYGRKTGDYVAKLSRCYSEFGDHGLKPFAQRLNALIESVEAREENDVSILDSRAGLNDVAAAVVTRMDAETLLFAADTPQTWAGYEFLFARWQNHPESRGLSNRLKMVNCLFRGIVQDVRWREYVDRSYEIFSHHFYEGVEPGAVGGDNAYSKRDPGPHNPLPIIWDQALQDFNPEMFGDSRLIDRTLIERSYGGFFSGMEEILLSTSSGSQNEEETD